MAMPINSANSSASNAYSDAASSVSNQALTISNNADKNQIAASYKDATFSGWVNPNTPEALQQRAAENLANNTHAALENPGSNWMSMSITERAKTRTDIPGGPFANEAQQSGPAMSTKLTTTLKVKATEKTLATSAPTPTSARGPAESQSPTTVASDQPLLANIQKLLTQLLELVLQKVNELFTKLNQGQNPGQPSTPAGPANGGTTPAGPTQGQGPAGPAGPTAPTDPTDPSKGTESPKCGEPEKPKPEDDKGTDKAQDQIQELLKEFGEIIKALSSLLNAVSKFSDTSKIDISAKMKTNLAA